MIAERVSNVWEDFDLISENNFLYLLEEQFIDFKDLQNISLNFYEWI